MLFRSKDVPDIQIPFSWCSDFAVRSKRAAVRETNWVQRILDLSFRPHASTESSESTSRKKFAAELHLSRGSCRRSSTISRSDDRQNAASKNPVAECHESGVDRSTNRGPIAEIKVRSSVRPLSSGKDDCLEKAQFRQICDAIAVFASCT